MTDNNYQPSIIKLDALHDSVIKSEDDRGFFSHLYRYLELVCDNSTLEASAWRLFGETYLHDHEDDRDNPDFQKLANMDLKFEGLEKLFTKVLSDYRGGSRVYYSWLFLYIFYYFKSVSPDTIATFGNNMPDAEALQNKVFSAKLQHELKSASFPLDMSGNDFIKRSDFSLYLEVFHTEFKDWLAKDTVPSAPLNKRSSGENMYEAMLSFPVLATPTVICNGYEYFFTPMTEGGDPCKIMTYCVDEKPNTEVSLSTLRERMNVKAEKGIAEALRKSPLLKMDKLAGGALTPFIYEVSAKTITINPTVKLTESEFERLRNTSKRSRLISK